METIRIKCPKCGVVLKIKPNASLKDKNITCPVCKESSPFIAYKTIQKTEEQGTDYYQRTNYKPEETIRSTDFTNEPIGKLKVSGTYYKLNLGRNIIGRKADASKADIQIPAGNRVSREHLVIDVKEVGSVGFVYYVSLYKERVNDTFINENILEFGDCLILKNEDQIHLPDITITFEITPSEKIYL